MNVNENEEGIISDSFGLRAKIFLFITPKNMVRELFRFGAGSKKITSQNEKNLAPLFQEIRAAIRAFAARVSEEVDCGYCPKGAVTKGLIPKDRIGFTPVVLFLDGEVLLQFG